MITYNGEIYNYRELRDERRRYGCRFRTESDIQVLVEAIERWGPVDPRRARREFRLSRMGDVSAGSLQRAIRHAKPPSSSPAIPIFAAQARHAVAARGAS